MNAEITYRARVVKDQMTRAHSAKLNLDFGQYPSGEPLVPPSKKRVLDAFDQTIARLEGKS